MVWSVTAVVTFLMFTRMVRRSCTVGLYITVRSRRNGVGQWMGGALNMMRGLRCGGMGWMRVFVMATMVVIFSASFWHNSQRNRSFRSVGNPLFYVKSSHSTNIIWDFCGKYISIQRTAQVMKQTNTCDCTQATFRRRKKHESFGVKFDNTGYDRCAIRFLPLCKPNYSTETCSAEILSFQKS